MSKPVILCVDDEKIVLDSLKVELLSKLNSEYMIEVAESGEDALEVIEEEPNRRSQLWKNAQRMREGLQEMGFDTGLSETPIIPVVFGEDRLAFRMGRGLYEQAIFANVSVSPAVPEGRALIRTSYMATHTDAHIERVLEAFRIVGRDLGVI